MNMIQSRQNLLAFAFAAILLVPLAAPRGAEPEMQNLRSGSRHPDVVCTLGGEVGAAAEASINRFRSAPFDSLPWIRADLTGEKASEFDEAGWGHILFRPFKNYSGDISGRFIEIMAMNSRGDLQCASRVQGPAGGGAEASASGRLFCRVRTGSTGRRPLIIKDIYRGTMMPALWGNARLLCGLVEASRAFPDDRPCWRRRAGSVTSMSAIPRFADPARMSEYTGGGTYAAGYVTCYFPAMEGLVKLHALTGERKYLETAITMAAFYKHLTGCRSTMPTACFVTRFRYSCFSKQPGMRRAWNASRNAGMNS